MRSLPLEKVYQKLEPGPVVFLTTSVGGKANVMVMSWHMMVEFKPPLIACVVSVGDYSHAALLKTRQCVIAIPGAELAKQIVGVGNCSGAEVDKFERFGLTAKPAKKVSPPLIAECGVNIECRLVDDSLGARYNLYVLEAVEAWIDPKRAGMKTLHHCGNGEFVVDGESIKLDSRMP